MKKPSIEDFGFKSIKLLNGGGAEVEFRFTFSTGNDGHTDELKIRRTLNVHDDLFRLLKSQKANVLAVEEINYRRMATTLEQMGVDNQKEVSQVVEAMTIDTMSKIEITGIKISGRDEKTNVVITYKKITGNKKIAGRATTAIQLSGSVYGFEQELEETITDLTSEVYNYIYKDKHGDSDQLELFAETDEEEEIPDEA